jgi:hypothetical protein
MLIGRRPFFGERKRVLKEIGVRDPKPPRQINDTIPPELERIVLRCLQKSPGDRYATAKDLSTDLKAWIRASTAPSLAHGDTTIRRPDRRGILTALSGVVVLLVVILGTAVAFFDRSESGDSSSESIVTSQQIASNRSYDLLADEPDLVLVSATDPAAAFHFDAQDRTATCATNGPAIALVGETKAGHYSIRVVLSKVAPHGEGGVVLGWKEYVGDDGGTWAAFDTILLRCVGNNRVVIERDVLYGRFSPEAGFTPNDRHGISGEVVEFAAAREYPLEIRIAAGQLRYVRFNGTELKQLLEVPDFQQDILDQAPAPHDFRGQMGLLNSRGSTTFRGFLFTRYDS